MGDVDPAEGLYHFLLMGLAWLRAEKPDRLACRGASIFSAYSLASPLFRQVKQLVPQSWDLRDLVLERSVLHAEAKRPRLRELRKLIAESDKHNVVIVPPPEPGAVVRPVAELTPLDLFGPMGCSHAITDAGIAFALEVAGQYEQIITAEAYLVGWQKHKVRMKGLNTQRSPRATTQGDGEGTEPEAGPRHIPQARYGEDDFDWS